MLIFSYGTLCEPLIRDRVLGRPVETRPAVLRGYRKACGWDYFTLVPFDGGEVRGVVFEAGPEDILRMDAWEDVPTYRMFTLRVETDLGEEEAGCYVMQEPPESYEFVDDDSIAAIPLADIIRDVERMMEARRLRAPMDGSDAHIPTDTGTISSTPKATDPPWQRRSPKGRSSPRRSSPRGSPSGRPTTACSPNPSSSARATRPSWATRPSARSSSTSSPSSRRTSTRSTSPAPSTSPATSSTGSTGTRPS